MYSTLHHPFGFNQFQQYFDLSIRMSIRPRNNTGVLFSILHVLFIPDDDYSVGLDLSIRMSIRPRNNTGVLFSIHADDMDFLLLQMVSGKVKYTALYLIHWDSVGTKFILWIWGLCKLYTFKLISFYALDWNSGATSFCPVCMCLWQKKLKPWP